MLLLHQFQETRKHLNLFVINFKINKLKKQRQILKISFLKNYSKKDENFETPNLGSLLGRF